MVADLGDIKGRGGCRGFVGFPGLSLQPLFVLGLDLFAAEHQSLYRSRPGILVEIIENVLDRPDHDVKRNTRLLPCFHQCPVERTQEKILRASANKRFFDLSEVIEVVELGFQIG